MSNWYNNIPKQGILCKAGNDSESLKDLALIVAYQEHYLFSFIALNDDFRYAEPLTLEEIKQYLLEFQNA